MKEGTQSNRQQNILDLIPNSLFPIPHSPFPIPCSLTMKHLARILPSVASTCRFIATNGVLSILFMLPAYGNEVDIPNASNLTIESREAGILSTEPASISSKWDNLSDTYEGTVSTPSSQQTPEAISLIRDQECGKINPLELVQNPASFFRECHSLKDELPIPATERIKYFEVPKLDSGIRVNLGRF
jgi:hypothetical protein